MNSKELKRNVARDSNLKIDRKTIAEVAAAKEEEPSVRSQIAKQAYQDKLKRELYKGAPTSWEMAVKVFEDGRKNYLESKTLIGYLTLLKTFTDWLKETGLDLEVPPAQLTEPVVEEYLDYCLNTRNNSKGTANSKLTTIKIFYDFLVEKGLVSYNPATKIKKFKAHETPIYSFSPEQLKRIFSVIPDSWRGARDNCLFRMILETGCRVDEALNASIKDITFRNGIPVKILFPETKNHKPREVSITPKLADAITFWLDRRKRKYNIDPDKVGKLHINMDFEVLNMRSIQRYFLEYCRIANVDKEGVRCSPYTLKHTFCKLFLLGGGSINALREIVGHVDHRSINKYTRATAKESSENHLAFAPSQIFDF